MKARTAEVLYDLTWNLAYRDARGHAPLCEDSRARFSMLLGWTQEFERLHKRTDWQTVDYMITVDEFFDGKVAGQ